MFKGNDTGFTKNIFISFLCLFLHHVSQHSGPYLIRYIAVFLLYCYN